jgi:hypothetical protein
MKILAYLLAILPQDGGLAAIGPMIMAEPTPVNRWMDAAVAGRHCWAAV